MSNGKTIWRWVTAVLALAALVPAAVLWSGPGRGGEDEGAVALRAGRPGGGTPTGWLWRTLRGAGEAAAEPDRGGPGERYRLAGVLVMQEGTGLERGDGDMRFAILDRLETGQQLVLGEGEEDGGVRAVRIEKEYVLLSEGGREEMVFLAPSALGGKRGGGRQEGMGAGKASAPEPLETNRFGARVGEARWEIERTALLQYAQEVMDDPKRVSGMYLGMEPDYNEEREIEGYRLNTKCGEAEFYGMIGLEDGDVIRRVNSIRMTSQRRAEFLMGEFFQERLGTVVLDIERDGEPKKLVYLLR